MFDSAARVWKIKQLEGGILPVATDDAVHRAPLVIVGQPGWGTAQAQVESPGNRQDRISQRLNFQPLHHVRAPKKAVVGVLGDIWRSLIRAELISRRKHDLAMQGLDRPVILHEPQPLRQP